MPRPFCSTCGKPVWVVGDIDAQAFYGRGHWCGCGWYGEAQGCAATCTFHVHENAADSVTDCNCKGKEVVPGVGVELPPVVENT